MVALEPTVGIGYYDSESTEPAFDNSHVCPICGEQLGKTQRPIVTILIHCTRWPLATFVRFHRDELPKMTELRYNQIIVAALFERDRLEKESRATIPDVFRASFP